jgi:hypothetical protein
VLFFINYDTIPNVTYICKTHNTYEPFCSEISGKIKLNQLESRFKSVSERDKYTLSISRKNKGNPTLLCLCALDIEFIDTIFACTL